MQSKNFIPFLIDYLRLTSLAVKALRRLQCFYRIEFKKVLLSILEGMSNGRSFNSFFHVCILFLVHFSFIAHPFLLPFLLYSLLYIYVEVVSLYTHSLIQSIRKVLFSSILSHGIRVMVGSEVSPLFRQPPSPIGLLWRTFSDRLSPLDLLRQTFSIRPSLSNLLRWTFSCEPSSVKYICNKLGSYELYARA